MNLHPRHWHYNTVELSERKRRLNVQSCVGYWVCFGPRGIVLCKAGHVGIVQDAASVFNTGGKILEVYTGRRDMYTRDRVI